MIRSVQGGVVIDLLVTPRASRAAIGPVHGDRLKVSVTSPPVEGAANKAVIELFARALKVARTRVSVAAGSAARRKTLFVGGVDREAILELLR